jgi:hypothetical protein
MKNATRLLPGFLLTLGLSAGLAGTASGAPHPGAPVSAPADLRTSTAALSDYPCHPLFCGQTS